MNECEKRREEKNNTEFSVTDITIRVLKDKKRVQKIVDEMRAHHERRTDTAILRSLEVRIASTQKEMDDTTTAYIQAVATQNSLFMTSCDKRMKELATLLEDLQTQYDKVETERKKALTDEEVFAFIAEFTNGDPHSKAHQKRVIDKLVNSVYLADNRIIIYFKFDNENPFISKEETDQAVENIEKEPSTTEVSGSVSIGGVAVNAFELFSLLPPPLLIQIN